MFVSRTVAKCLRQSMHKEERFAMVLDKDFRKAWWSVALGLCIEWEQVVE